MTLASSGSAMDSSSTTHCDASAAMSAPESRCREGGGCLFNHTPTALTRELEEGCQSEGAEESLGLSRVMLSIRLAEVSMAGGGGTMSISGSRCGISHSLGLLHSLSLFHSHDCPGSY